jgi:NAD(P)H-flavin reductase
MTRVGIIGPYGSRICDPSLYSHTILVGSGTGIMPMLSILEHNTTILTQIDR